MSSTAILFYQQFFCDLIIKNGFKITNTYNKVFESEIEKHHYLRTLIYVNPDLLDRA